jgi:hypothetical protein
LEGHQGGDAGGADGVKERLTRLDFGCAFEKHDGWLGSDLNDYGQDHVGDILRPTVA